MALVVGVQVGGALGVVRPGSVDTVYLLPVTRGITLAVGASWRLDHSQDINTPVCVLERRCCTLLRTPAGSRCSCSHTSVVEVIDVLWTQHRNQLTRSALGPADDAVPLRDTVASFTKQTAKLTNYLKYRQPKNHCALCNTRGLL